MNEVKTWPDQVESANSIIDEHHPAPDQFKLFFIHQLIPKMEMLYLVSNLETRTNNIMEGFNSYLAKNYRCHMNVWLFLAKFRQEESIFFIKLSQLENGATFSAQKSQYARRTQMILHAISQRRRPRSGIYVFVYTSRRERLQTHRTCTLAL